MSRLVRFDLPLLAALAATPLLGPLWGLAGLLLLLPVWLWLVRPPVREGTPVVAATAVAFACLTVATVVLWWPSVRGPEALESELSARWATLIDDLQAEAGAAGSIVAAPLHRSAERRLVAFETLDSLASRSARRSSFLLLDPNGEAYAWSGPGLSHQLRSQSARGEPGTLLARQGFTAATLAFVLPLEEAPRPWQLLVGRSYSTAALPFDVPFGWPRSGYRWALERPREQPPSSTSPATAVEPRQLMRLELDEGLEVVVRPPDAEVVDRLAVDRLTRLASIALAIGLLSLVTIRELSVLLLLGAGPSLRRRHPWHNALLGMVGLVLLGRAIGSGPEVSTLMALGFLSALLAVHYPRAPPGQWRGSAAIAGAGTVLTVAGAAGLVMMRLGPLDLGSSLFGDVRSATVRLAVWALMFAGLAAWRQRGEHDTFELLPWIGLAAAALGACVTDHVVLSLLLLSSGGAALAAWSTARHTPARLLALGLASTILAAGTWEVAYRVGLAHAYGTEILVELASPRAAREAELYAEMEQFFAELDMAELALGDPDRIEERQDLAFAVWQASPLSRSPARSALTVEPQGDQVVRFSFGLGDSTGLESTTTSASGLAASSRAGFVGRAPLISGGALWGLARYRLLLRPGDPPLPPRRRDLEAEFLRGRSDSGLASPPGGGAAALFHSDGSLLASSEVTPPRLDPASLPVGLDGERLDKRRVWTAALPEGAGESPALAVLTLPVPSWLQSLTRVAISATGTTLLLLVGGLIVMVFAFQRSVLRSSLRRQLRSYSRRLIVVFTLLLLIPLALLNLVLMRSIEERSSRGQRAGGEAALTTAQSFLLRHLTNLQPGFTIDNQIDDELLQWLSRSVGYDVNLYWRGYVYASSRPDLFTAGLIPRRIPGEVFSRLSLRGESVADRLVRVGPGTRYLEVYGPLRVPGENPEEGNLFLSIPLLAQQEEATAELHELRRRATVVTTALFLLLIAVGSRLARSFTRPLTEMVRATDRIAAGAAELGLEPSDPELSALAEAIDDMARRIADARRHLLLEKRVLEGVVNNINAAVISFDREYRVSMRNRVATELLEVSVGDTLDQLTRTDWLEPVADFLNERSPTPRRTTVKMRTGGSGVEGEWNLVWVPVPGEGDPAALLVVEDVSEVLRAQRLEAWAEMARLIAHEIKNPLTPIRLSTEHLQRVYSASPERLDEVFDRCTNNILEQVQELQETAADFSSYSDILRASPERGDLVEALRQIVGSYEGTVAAGGVEVRFRPACVRLDADFDVRLLGRAVRNLVENALRASREGEHVDVDLVAENGHARVSVLDRGPGVPSDHLERIFDPYFSASSGGTGLGLPIARRVAEEHGGTISAANRAGGGLEVAVTIPLP